MADLLSFNQDLLNNLPEVALGIAGFAGIVSAFRREEDSIASWTPTDMRSLRSIVEVGFFVIFMSFLPSVLLADDVKYPYRQNAWVFLNLMMAFVVFLLIAQTVYEVFILKIRVRRPSVVIAVLVLASLYVLLLIFNAFAFKTPEIYEVGLLIGMGVQALQFWFLIVGGPIKPPPV